MHFNAHTDAHLDAQKLSTIAVPGTSRRRLPTTSGGSSPSLQSLAGSWGFLRKLPDSCSMYFNAHFDAHLRHASPQLESSVTCSNTCTLRSGSGNSRDSLIPVSR